MAAVSFRFYEELNDFLPPARRGRDFTVPFRERQSVKDLIESLGVPHTEVDLILVNGETVDFSYRVRPGDRLSVYPVFEAFDIGELNRLRPAPLRVPRFVLDTHLGRLARYLRLLGFDTLYSNAFDDAQLARLAAGDRGNEGDGPSHPVGGLKRILLTRDHGLLKRKSVTHGCFVRADDPRRQAAEILSRFQLYNAVRPFHRCTRCNGLIGRVDKSEAAGRVPPRVALAYPEFSRCGDCGRIYWKGSHYDHMRNIIDDLLRDAGAAKRRTD